MLDRDGYPTEEAITRLGEWNVVAGGPLLTKATLDDFLQLLESMWWRADWGFRRGKTRLWLSTGGWSGNEDVIATLRHTWFWHLCWVVSRRGGHYTFDLAKVPSATSESTVLPRRS